MDIQGCRCWILLQGSVRGPGSFCLCPGDREGRSPSCLALYLPGGPAVRSILAKSLSVTPLHTSQTLLTASSLYLPSTEQYKNKLLFCSGKIRCLCISTETIKSRPQRLFPSALTLERDAPEHSHIQESALNPDVEKGLRACLGILTTPSKGTSTPSDLSGLIQR